MIKCVLKLVTSHELGLNICNVVCTHQKHTITEVIVATRGLSFVIVPSNKDALSHHFYVCLVCSYVCICVCVFVCVHTCVCVFICVYMSSSVPTIPFLPSPHWPALCWTVYTSMLALGGACNELWGVAVLPWGLVQYCHNQHTSL